jgi:hypothetical protein
VEPRGITKSCRSTPYDAKQSKIIDQNARYTGTGLKNIEETGIAAEKI